MSSPKLSPLFQIVCIEDQNSEKFDYLARRAIGWGVQRLFFAATEMYGLRQIEKFREDEVLVIIGNFKAFVSLGETRVEQCADFVNLLTSRQISLEQIIILKGDESPEQIEDLVRVRVHSLLFINS